MAVSYTICDTSDLALVNFGEVLQDSPDTVRKSVDGTLAILKWAGDVPPSVAALPSRGAVYDLAGISAVIETAVWTQPPTP